jgi:arylsulfatase A-like enzyme
MIKILLIFFTAFPLLFSSAAKFPKASKKSPNILVILADDLGYNDLSSFGSKDIRTPNIDAIVNSGVRFTNFYANSSVCSPTRASLLTGRYPELAGVPGVIRTDVTNSWGYLSQKITLLPALLKVHNYHTALVGKWHLGLEPENHPNKRGFDFFHGFLGDMMDDYMTHLRENINFMRLNQQEINPKGHATDLFSDWTVDYIKEQQNKKGPFFLYLAYNAPHDPIQPLTEWVQKVRAREPNISEKRASLLALIEHMDAGIGKVIQALKSTGAYENTIIVFTSDNGGRLDLGANNGYTRSGKGSMYEGGLKVPAGIFWPGQPITPITSDRIHLTMDIFPTLLEAAGINYNKSMIDGTSFYQLLQNKKDTFSERTVFFCRREGDAEYGGKTIDAVRKGDWKLLQNCPFASRELYNIKEDPLEQNNLALSNKEKFRELSNLQRRHLQRSGNVAWQK